tara:strand:+ start:161286 stop:161921 length:636 start_codon:yes stop_codon:yes gene_type:complete
MKVRILILIVFLFMAMNGFAQNQDFGIWTGVKVSKQIGKKFKTFGEVQGRFYQNATTWQSAFFQTGGSYKFAKWYKLGITYRYTNYGEGNANRFDIDNVFKYKIEKNTFEIRLKYQKSFVTNKIKGNRFRIRFKYEYKVNKKFIPYIKAQYFYSQTYNFNNWNQQRYTLGAVIKVAKKNYIDLFYNYEFEYNVNRPQAQYTLGLKYKLEIK